MQHNIAKCNITLQNATLKNPKLLNFLIVSIQKYTQVLQNAT